MRRALTSGLPPLKALRLFDFRFSSAFASMAGRLRNPEPGSRFRPTGFRPTNNGARGRIRLQAAGRRTARRAPLEFGEHRIASEDISRIEAAHGTEKPHVKRKYLERIHGAIARKRNLGFAGTLDFHNKASLLQPRKALLKVRRSRPFANLPEDELLVFARQTPGNRLPGKHGACKEAGRNAFREIVRLPVEDFLSNGARRTCPFFSLHELFGVAQGPSGKKSRRASARMLRLGLLGDDGERRIGEKRSAPACHRTSGLR